MESREQRFARREQRLARQREYQRKYQRKYREEHREEHHTYNRKYRQGHKEQVRAYKKRWYDKQPKKSLDALERQARAVIARRTKLKCEYGLTVEEYEKLLCEQEHKCFICGKPENGRRLAVDHDHVKSGSAAVRKLLCRSCNAALGFVKEDIQILEKMIAYLKAHKELSGE